MFIGRTRELDFLNRKYASPQAELVVLYGRRRIGKTELLKQFSIGKPCIFHACSEVPEKQQLIHFSRALLTPAHPASRYLSEFSDWHQALEALAELPSAQKQILIIDEFPYLARNVPSFASTLQNLWDHVLSKANIMIVLCGSSMSFIEKEVLSEKNPLYGRATGIWKLEDLPFNEAKQFVNRFNADDQMATYGILGGVPYYLKQFDDQKTLKQNVVDQILERGSVLYSEVDFLIRQEMRETTTYNAIIEAIALGNTKLSNIADKTQISKTTLTAYLKNLTDLGLIQREFSVDTGIKEYANIQRGLYNLSCDFFRFWYSYIFTNRSLLEFGDTESVWNDVIEPTLNAFMSTAFEKVCQKYLMKCNLEKKLPFRFDNIGRWWYKNHEIDIVAVDRKGENIILGECKYRKSPFSTTDFRVLEEKSSLFHHKNVFYYCFSKSGFTQSLQELAENRKDLKLITLAEI